MNTLESWIGLKVQKKGKTRKERSPKPFKSGFKTNTVKGVTINPNTGKPAFTFIEDESVVDADLCVAVEPAPTPENLDF